MSSSRRLAEVEWKLLSDLIENRFGLVFDDTRREILESRLAARLEVLHLQSFNDYYHYLLFHPDRDREFTEVTRSITNGESYFFREPHHFDILQNDVLDQVLPGLNGRPLRILSAGCSSGQEPYTLSIIMHQAARHRPVRSWEIHACDINPARLAQAWHATYGQASFRGCPPDVLESYFTAVGDSYRLKPIYRIGVKFFEANLVEWHDTDWQEYDVIFCRNVLIYFSDQAFKSAIDLFASCLAPGGHLFLGHSESLINKRTDFQPVCSGGKVVYRKTEE